MDIELLSLTFNHEPASSRESALNIRINGRTPVQIPEWVSRRGSQFPAAYAAEEAADAAVFIVGAFAGPPESVVSIMAVPSSAGGAHVLGAIGPLDVALDANGESGPVILPLREHGFAFAGVGAHDVRWRWLQRGGEHEPWRQFAETSHVVFTVLRTPTSPWLQQPFVPGNTQLPWADVLEWACRWAAGSMTREAAATQVTHALFALAGERFRYSCVAGAPSNYSFPAFDCSGFLERLAGGFGRGPNVNCSDCATVVSTFSNALGCDLWQARMFNQVTPFAVNPLQLIGQPSLGLVCGRGVFNYHEVAWVGLCTEREEVYDACVSLLAPAAPFPPFFTLVPANIVFGRPNEGLYRDLLAAPSSRSICRPQPALSRQRRPVF